MFHTKKAMRTWGHLQKFWGDLIIIPAKSWENHGRDCFFWKKYDLPLACSKLIVIVQSKVICIYTYIRCGPLPVTVSCRIYYIFRIEKSNLNLYQSHDLRGCRYSAHTQYIHINQGMETQRQLLFFQGPGLQRSKQKHTETPGKAQDRKGASFGDSFFHRNLMKINLSKVEELLLLRSVGKHDSWRHS